MWDGLLRSVLALAMVAVWLVVAPAPAAQAAGSINLAKTGGGSVLFGGKATFTLTATNDGGVEQYNLSFRDVLPTGVSYVAGSTSPASAGDPQVISIPADPSATPPVEAHQILIWNNVSDLTTGSSEALSYSVQTDPAVYGIGETFVNAADAWSSSDPFEVPTFTDTGTPVPGLQTVSDAATATTAVTAIRIRKSSSPTPEGELMRGVNDNQAVYTLAIENNSQGPSSGITVTDFLPAGLEFLGCNGAFHSTTPEYPGASNTVTALPCASTTAPTRVETVLNPAGYPAGVYTKVTWVLTGTLAAGATRTIAYAAGIPQRSNTMTFAGGTPAVSGAQAANLNNNTGASTRELVAESGLTNRARVDATFEGGAGTADDLVVFDTTTHTVTPEDLRLLKGVSPDDFTQGGVATYTLTVDVSEYADLANLVITDEIPGGLCPLDSATNWTSPALPECAAAAGYAPTNAIITNVVPNGDGYRVTLTPTDQTLAAGDSTLTITYKARMREYFDPNNSSPTSALDSFTNTASIAGSSTPNSGVNSPDTGTLAISDTSSATISGGGPAVHKLRMPYANPMTCSDTKGDYKDEASLLASETAFSEGDRVCFWLSIEFPAGVDTRNPQLTDFLPANLSYEAGSAVVQPGSAAYVQQPASPTSYVQWLLGSGSNPRVVRKGSVFNVRFSAIVGPTPAQTSNPSTVLKDNLAKFRYTNTAGKAQSLRDSVPVPLAPPPLIGITKGVSSIVSGIDGSTTVIDGGTPPGVDGSIVRGGDRVTFRIDPRNLAQVGAVNGVPILAPDIWDVLPAGITCSAIVAGSISAGGTCYDPGPTRPNVAGDTTSSVIRWQLPDTYVMTPQQYGTALTYTMQVPAVVSVSTIFTNTAAVAAYKTRTNVGTASPAVHNPANNINADTPAASQDVPADNTRDTSYVQVPAATITKTAATGVTETGNTAAQATIGETVTYTITVTVPKHTTVLGASMREYNQSTLDALPTYLVLAGTPTATRNGTGDLGGVTLNTATGALVFPATYTNSDAVDHVFVVTLPTRVSNASTTAPVHGGTITNTARFTSYTSTGATIGPWDASSATGIVEPARSLTKSASPNTNVGAGSAVTYTMTAGNTAGRPPLHDTVVTDCVPAGLTVGAITWLAGTSGTATPGGCTDTLGGSGTLITWTIGDIPGGSTRVQTYPATVTSPAGSQVYRNGATITGSSLANGANGGTGSIERVYTLSTYADVTARAATVTKTATPANLTIGQRGSWTVTVTLPANIAFYDSIVTDAIPTGFAFSGLTVDSVVCTGFTAGTCPTTPLTSLTSSPNPAVDGATATVGWAIGDIAPSASARTLAITYSAVVMDIAGNAAETSSTGNTTLNSKQNTAYYRWNVVNGSTPTSVTGTLSNNASGFVRVRIVEPLLVMSKSVDDSTVEPGQVFTYTVNASNTGRASVNLSTAYNVTVVDCLPAGLVFGGFVSGSPTGTTAAGPSNGCAAGTTAVIWTGLGPIAAGASLASPLKYTATLAASTGLTTAALNNSAKATHYDSLATGGRTTYTSVAVVAPVTPQFPRVTPTKSVESPIAYVDSPMTWTISLPNSGTALAKDVRIDDVLPPNWTYVGSPTAVLNGVAQPFGPPSISIAGTVETLTWDTTLTIPAGQTLIVTFQAKPLAAATGTPGTGTSNPHTNTVSATVKDGAGYTGNASGSYVTRSHTAQTYIHAADLSVTKTSSAGASHLVTAGTDLKWTLTATNSGPNQAVDVVLTDTLPGADVFDSIAITSAPSPWSCSLTGLAVTCTRPTLDSGASSSIEITGHVKAGADADVSLLNAADISSKTYDPVTSNNHSEVTDTTARVVDIAIDKTGGTPAVAGSNVGYSLVVTNNGPSDGRSGVFTVVDTIPTGTEFVEATSVGDAWACSYNSGTRQLTCTLTAAPATGTPLPAIAVTVKVNTGRTADITNAATVTPAEPALDTVPANNTDSVTTSVATSADLGLAKAHSTAETDWIAGGTGEYTFTVSNYGPSDAAAPRVVDDLPASLTFVSVVSGGGHWSCSVGTGNRLTCDRDAALTGGTSGSPTTDSFTIRVRVAASHTGPITNTAVVSSTTTDPNLPNNTATDTTGTTRRADIGIEKDGPADALAGNQVSFTLTVTNHGESDSPAPVAGTVDPITVVDTLPAGMTYVSANGTDWTCAQSGQQVTCTLGTGLNAGASRTITVVARIAAGLTTPATLQNSASVTVTPLVDPVPVNNTDSHDVAVTSLAALTIDKTVLTPADASVNAGNQVTYRLRVHNEGPSVARNVVVTDPLFVGLTLDDVDAPAGWTCLPGLVVSCSVDDLAPGTANDAVIDVTGTVNSGTIAGTYPNTAVVSSPTDPTDDDDTAQLTVTTRANLDLTKSHDPAGGRLAGETVTFTLRATNPGPSDAVADVTIVDTLPPGMTYLSSSTGWECTPEDATPSGQVVTCVLPGDATVIAGADAPPLELTAQIAADLDPALLNDDGELVNRATVTSGTPGTEGSATDRVPVTFDADLSIVKSHTTGVSGRIGDPLEFTLDVANAGPSTALDVVVTDDLPAGLDFESATGDGWTCSESGGTITCELDEPLAPATAAEPITVTVTVRRAAWPSVTNTASVAASEQTPDSNPANNSDDETVPVLDAANVTITKTVDPDTVVAGSDTLVRFTLTALNEGPAPATDVVVGDDLPDGLSLVSVTAPSGWTCGTTDPVSCTTATLAADAPAVFVIAARVSADVLQDDVLVNTATISTTTADDDPDDNSDVAEVMVDAEADLSLAKTVLDSPVHAGEQAGFGFTVLNAGPSDAEAPITITDTLPPGLAYASHTGPWTCVAGAVDPDDGQQVVCTRDGSAPLADGATDSSLTITVDVAAWVNPADLDAGELVNTAHVESDTTDPDETNNDSEAAVGIDQLVDLSIIKTHDDTTVVAGEPLDFTLAVANGGPSDELGTVTVTDTIPDGMSYVGATGTGWDCSMAEVAGDEVVTCTRDGLAVGPAPDITLTVDVLPDAGPGTLPNTAVVAGPTQDSDEANNSSTDEVVVGDVADVAIVKTVTEPVPATVNAGEDVEFTLTVTNTGPSDADNVVVADPAVPGLVLTGFDAPDGWLCSLTDGALACAGGTLADGASAEITVTATVESWVTVESLDNTATVASDTPDPVPGNNTSTAAIGVTTSADLSLAKSHTVETVTAGETIDYTFVVANAGPSDAAADVVVTDNLPEGMSFVGDDSTEWDCVAGGTDGRTVTCTLTGDATLAAGAEETFAITVAVDSDLLSPAVLQNTADVTSPTDDPEPDNNGATDEVPLVFAADLSIAKTHSGVGTVGEDVVFTLQVANAGPSTAREVTVSDTLPDGLGFVSFDADGWTCAATGQQLDCALNSTLAAGSVAEPLAAPPIRVTVTVLAGAFPQVDNTATVTAETPDPDDSDNSSTDTLYVDPRVDLSITKTHSPEELRVGEQATYTLTVTNAGPTADPGPIVVTDDLPEGLSPVSVSGDGWECGIDVSLVTCSRIGELGVEESATITIVVDVLPAAYPEVSNTATVETESVDVDPENNSVTDTATGVLPSHDLELVKSLVSVSSSRAVWRIQVTNHGPNEAPVGSIVVIDNLPKQLRLESVGGDDAWSCETSANSLTCLYDGVLPAGETATLIVRTTVRDGFSGQVTNSAILEGVGTDSDTGKVPPVDGLAYTGAGSAMPLLVLGLLAIGAGVLLRSRRRAD
jgi:uncharacterized repeat protein (TIGR01451 family)/fimbrial isopeptide formation D2 family protein